MKTRSSKRTDRDMSQSFRHISSMIERHSKSTKSRKSRKKGITLTTEHPYHPENPNFERFETAYYIKYLIRNGASSKNILDYLDILARNGINMGSNLHRILSKEDIDNVVSVVSRDYTSKKKFLTIIDASKTQAANDELNASQTRKVKDPMYGHTGSAAGKKIKHVREKVEKVEKVEEENYNLFTFK